MPRYVVDYDLVPLFRTYPGGVDNPRRRRRIADWEAALKLPAKAAQDNNALLSFSKFNIPGREYNAEQKGLELECPFIHPCL